MSTSRAEQSRSSSQTPVTIADVIACIDKDPGLDPKRRREFSSALRTICRALNCAPSELLAQPRHLREKMKFVSAASAGVGTERWANVRSLALAALKRVGIKTMPGRYREAYLGAWEELRARLPDRRFQSGLSRMMSYCSHHGILPDEVSCGTFSDFHSDLEEKSLSRDPGGSFLDTCKLWNKAAVEIAGWPTLLVPLPYRRQDFSMPIEAFPSAFQVDWANYLGQRANPDVFADDYCKPVRRTTVRNRRQNILMAATALVKSGFPIEQITSLDVLVKIENAKAALSFLFERAGNAKTGHLHQIATLLKTIARHYVRVDHATLERLVRMSKAIRPEHTGLTEKNKECLRQFSDLKKLHALLMLPQRLVQAAEERKRPRRSDAVAVAIALAIAIELQIPIRSDNLTGLDCKKHLPPCGEKIHLAIAAAETKNTNSIEAELSARVTPLLDLYRAKYRPLLMRKHTSLLFPGEDGRRRANGGFSGQISARILEEIGVRITLHQFRHLAVWLYLKEHPGDYENVRRLLGHKSLETTLRYYHELDSVLAVQRYEKVINRLIDQQEGDGDGHDASV